MSTCFVCDKIIWFFQMKVMITGTREGALFAEWAHSKCAFEFQTEELDGGKQI